MVGRHILDGDFVILERGADPRNGQIVAALIYGERTLKIFVTRGRETFLKAENPKYPILKTDRDFCCECCKPGSLEAHSSLGQSFNMPAISTGLDEVPMACKNIREVIAVQNDLVKVLGQFDPKLVKMAPSGERPED